MNLRFYFHYVWLELNQEIWLFMMKSEPLFKIYVLLNMFFNDCIAWFLNLLYLSKSETT